MAQGQVNTLMERILALKNKGLTGARVFMSFLRRRTQPIQARSVLGYLYKGKTDSSRSKEADLSDEEALNHVQKYLKNVDVVPPRSRSTTLSTRRKRLDADSNSRCL